MQQRPGETEVTARLNLGKLLSDNQYFQSEQQINGAQFPLISDNAQASGFFKTTLITSFETNQSCDHWSKPEYGNNCFICDVLLINVNANCIVDVDGTADVNDRYINWINLRDCYEMIKKIHNLLLKRFSDFRFCKLRYTWEFYLFRPLKTILDETIWEGNITLHNYTL